MFDFNKQTKKSGHDDVKSLLVFYEMDPFTISLQIRLFINKLK